MSSLVHPVKSVIEIHCFLQKRLCKNILPFERVGALHGLLIVSAKKSKALFYRCFIHKPLESVFPKNICFVYFV